MQYIIYFIQKQEQIFFFWSWNYIWISHQIAKSVLICFHFLIFVSLSLSLNSLSLSMDGIVKKEIIEAATRALQSSGGIGNAPFLGGAFDSVIELSSSSSSSSSSESSDSDDGDDDGGNGRNGSGSGVVLGRRVRVSNGGGGVAMMTKKKKRRVDELGGVIVPAGFLQQLPPPVTTAVVTTAAEADVPVAQSIAKCSSKQFWKAGDYEGAPCSEWESSTRNLSLCFLFGWWENLKEKRGKIWFLFWIGCEIVNVVVFIVMK